MQSLQEQAVDWKSALGGYLCCLTVSRGTLRPQGGVQQEDWEPGTLQGGATALLWVRTALLPLPPSGLSFILAQIWQTSITKPFFREEGEEQKMFFEGLQQESWPIAKL